MGLRSLFRQRDRIDPWPSIPLSLPGRSRAITGAASGIGLAAALKYAGLGMKVAMADANADLLRRSAREPWRRKLTRPATSRPSRRRQRSWRGAGSEERRL